MIRVSPRRPLLALAAFAATLTLSASGASSLDQWPQWRGPLATGVAPKAQPPVRWSETENVRWKYAIPGYGTSTPIIWEDQVFLLTAIPTGRKVGSQDTPAAQNAPATGPRGPGPGGGRRGGGQPAPTEVHQFAVIAIDRVTGQERWRRIAREEVPHEGHHETHGYASYSPVTDGEHLYVHYGSRGLHAFDLQGNPLWSKDLGRMRTRNGFGEGGSPALKGDLLVVNWDHEGEDFIAAFDKRSGAERWRQPRNEITTWTTPLIIEQNGRSEVIVPATDRIRSYDLVTGRQVWECRGNMTQNVIPAPVADADTVYVMSGFRGASLLAIRLGRTGDLTETDAITWRLARSTPYVPSPLLYGERLYFLKGNNGRLSCYATRDGKPLLDEVNLTGLPNFYASPMGADGRVYLTGREGKTLVIRDADALEILATNELDDQIDASPAAVGRQLFLRGHKKLYCLEEG